MKNPFPRPVLLLCCLMVSALLSALPVHPQDKPAEEDKQEARSEKGYREKEKLPDTDELLHRLIRHKYRKERPLEKKTPDELLKTLVHRRWFEQKEQPPSVRTEKRVTAPSHVEEDLTAIKKSASEDLKNILVLVGEIPVSDQDPLFAPVFLTDRKNVFGTRSDMAFTWVGYKSTLKLTQKRFPWKKTNLQETFIGSFLYASGTNLGFLGGKYQEEYPFYTNYFSEIVTLKYFLPRHFAVAGTMDSRQYFFEKRNTPDSFIMPRDHVNFFPRLDLSYERLSEKGIDQLTEGWEFATWAGYGIRSRWEEWGDESNPQTGEKTQTFLITSATLTAGALYKNNQNLVLKARFKGGKDNDFLSRPRFGGTIDNAKLDVVHGFQVDSFRVNSFGLVNLRYGVDLLKWLRGNLYLDYAHVFSPGREDILGSGYGFRFLTFGGLPIWITHGIGRKVYPERTQLEQVVMVMTAAGW